MKFVILICLFVYLKFILSLALETKKKIKKDLNDLKRFSFLEKSSSYISMNKYSLASSNAGTNRDNKKNFHAVFSIIKDTDKLNDRPQIINARFKVGESIEIFNHEKLVKRIPLAEFLSFDGEILFNGTREVLAIKAKENTIKLDKFVPKLDKFIKIIGAEKFNDLCFYAFKYHFTLIRDKENISTILIIICFNEETNAETLHSFRKEMEINYSKALTQNNNYYHMHHLPLNENIPLQYYEHHFNLENFDEEIQMQKKTDVPYLFTMLTKEGVVLNRENTINPQTVIYSFRHDQVLSCRGLAPNVLKSKINPEISKLFKPDECCLSYVIDKFTYCDGAMFCSLKSEPWKCTAEIQIFKASFYNKCMEENVLDLFKLVKSFKGLTEAMAELSFLQKAKNIFTIREFIYHDFVKYLNRDSIIFKISTEIETLSKLYYGKMMENIQEQCRESFISNNYNSSNAAGKENIKNKAKLSTDLTIEDKAEILSHYSLGILSAVRYEDIRLEICRDLLNNPIFPKTDSDNINHTNDEKNNKTIDALNKNNTPASTTYVKNPRLSEEEKQNIQRNQFIFNYQKNEAAGGCNFTRTRNITTDDVPDDIPSTNPEKPKPSDLPMDSSFTAYKDDPDFFLMNMKTVVEKIRGIRNITVPEILVKNPSTNKLENGSNDMPYQNPYTQLADMLDDIIDNKTLDEIIKNTTKVQRIYEIIIQTREKLSQDKLIDSIKDGNLKQLVLDLPKLIDPLIKNSNNNFNVNRNNAFNDFGINPINAFSNNLFNGNSNQFRFSPGMLGLNGNNILGNIYDKNSNNINNLAAILGGNVNNLLGSNMNGLFYNIGNQYGSSTQIPYGMKEDKNFEDRFNVQNPNLNNAQQFPFLFNTPNPFVFNNNNYGNNILNSIYRNMPFGFNPNYLSNNFNTNKNEKNPAFEQTQNNPLVGNEENCNEDQNEDKNITSNSNENSIGDYKKKLNNLLESSQFQNSLRNSQQNNPNEVSEENIQSGKNQEKSPQVQDDKIQIENKKNDHPITDECNDPVKKNTKKANSVQEHNKGRNRNNNQNKFSRNNNPYNKPINQFNVNLNPFNKGNTPFRHDKNPLMNNNFLNTGNLPFAQNNNLLSNNPLNKVNIPLPYGNYPLKINNLFNNDNNPSGYGYIPINQSNIDPLNKGNNRFNRNIYPLNNGNQSFNNIKGPFNKNKILPNSGKKSNNSHINSRNNKSQKAQDLTHHNNMGKKNSFGNLNEVDKKTKSRSFYPQKRVVKANDLLKNSNFNNRNAEASNSKGSKTNLKNGNDKYSNSKTSNSSHNDDEKNGKSNPDNSNSDEKLGNGYPSHADSSKRKEANVNSIPRKFEKNDPDSKINSDANLNEGQDIDSKNTKNDPYKEMTQNSNVNKGINKKNKAASFSNKDGRLKTGKLASNKDSTNQPKINNFNSAHKKNNDLDKKENNKHKKYNDVNHFNGRGKYSDKEANETQKNIDINDNKNDKEDKNKDSDKKIKPDDYEKDLKKINHNDPYSNFKSNGSKKNHEDYQRNKGNSGENELQNDNQENESKKNDPSKQQESREAKNNDNIDSEKSGKIDKPNSEIHKNNNENDKQNHHSSSNRGKDISDLNSRDDNNGDGRAINGSFGKKNESLNEGKEISGGEIKKGKYNNDEDNIGHNSEFDGSNNNKYLKGHKADSKTVQGEKSEDKAEKGKDQKSDKEENRSDYKSGNGDKPESDTSQGDKNKEKIKNGKNNKNNVDESPSNNIDRIKEDKSDHEFLRGGNKEDRAYRGKNNFDEKGNDNQPGNKNNEDTDSIMSQHKKDKIQKGPIKNPHNDERKGNHNDTSVRDKADLEPLRDNDEDKIKNRKNYKNNHDEKYKENKHDNGHISKHQSFPRENIQSPKNHKYNNHDLGSSNRDSDDLNKQDKDSEKTDYGNDNSSTTKNKNDFNEKDKRNNYNVYKNNAEADSQNGNIKDDSGGSNGNLIRNPEGSKVSYNRGKNHYREEVKRDKDMDKSAKDNIQDSNPSGSNNESKNMENDAHSNSEGKENKNLKNKKGDIFYSNKKEHKKDNDDRQQKQNKRKQNHDTANEEDSNNNSVGKDSGNYTSKEKSHDAKVSESNTIKIKKTDENHNNREVNDHTGSVVTNIPNTKHVKRNNSPQNSSLEDKNKEDYDNKKQKNKKISGSNNSYSSKYENLNNQENKDREKENDLFLYSLATNYHNSEFEMPQDKGFIEENNIVADETQKLLSVINSINSENHKIPYYSDNYSSSNLRRGYYNSERSRGLYYS